MKCFLPLLLVSAAAFAGDVSPRIERLDPALDALLAPDVAIEKLAEGFDWSEGPVWFQGSIVFSDVPQNIIYQWKPGAREATIFMKPSGMLNPRSGFREQGSNGLGIDAQGRLLICQHGERRIARVEKSGTQTALAEKFEGRRFNSPNDLVLRRNGDLYFTDPPYGLEGLNQSPLKELDFNGVFRLTPDGRIFAVIKDLTFPNGLGFSPNEKTFYVAVSDPAAPRIMAYDVQPDGSMANGRVFFDAKPLVAPDSKGLPDGLKIDAQSNLWATGPGGVLILSPRGEHLGTILTAQATGNCAWGDDGSSLFITADAFLYRVKTKTKGAGW
jgi:gluconolactonase